MTRPSHTSGSSRRQLLKSSAAAAAGTAVLSSARPAVHAAGANTIRFKWDTQDEENGDGPLASTLVEELRIRTTQFGGSQEREPHVSIRGFVREFPRVVENEGPFSIDLRDVEQKGSE